MTKPSCLCVFVVLCLVQSSYSLQNDAQYDERCPEFWVQYDTSCYKFVKSPIRPRNEARRNCQAYGADLASVNSFEEHGFIINQLLQQDPQHRQWYIGGKYNGPQSNWMHDDMITKLNDMEKFLLPEQHSTLNRDYVAYTYSNQLQKWGLEKVPGDRYLLYICEIPINNHHLIIEERSYQYGYNIDDQQKVPNFIWKKDGMKLRSSSEHRIRKRSFFVWAGQLDPQIRGTFKHELLMRCCAVANNLEIAYIWTHNNISLHNSTAETSGHITINGGELKIRSLTTQDSGEYQCIVRCAIGEMSSTTTLFVEGPPGPPGDVQVFKVVNKSVKLHWTEGVTNGRQITDYRVSARSNWNSTWYIIDTDFIPKEVDRYKGRYEAFLENVLQPWSKYEFKIAAGNDFGFGELSLPTPQVDSPADRPYKTPTNITGGDGKIGDLTIVWKPLAPYDQNGPDIYYKVYWRLLNHDTDFQYETLQASGYLGMTVVHIKPELFYTQYQVKIQAFNSIGAGPISEPEVIYSVGDIPRVSLQQISAVPYNSTAINVTWIPIDRSREMLRGKLIGYKFKYWKKNANEREEDAVYFLSRSTKDWALLGGLHPATEYYAKVMVCNSAGEGPESERFIERTYKKAPQNPPFSVVIDSFNPHILLVTWEHVASSNTDEEPIKGYKVRVWLYDADMSTANETIVTVGNKLEAQVINITTGRVYNLRVLAYSDGGNGRMSWPVQYFQMGNPDLYNTH